MIDKIQDAASKLFTVSMGELLSKSRRRKVVIARHLSMLAAREIYNISFKKNWASFQKRSFDCNTCSRNDKLSDVNRSDVVLSIFKSYRKASRC